MNSEKDQEMKVNTIMYILAISEASYRHAKGLPPFEMSDPACIELIYSRAIYFVETGEDSKITEAHESFLGLMKDNGWKYGPESLKDRTHPMILPYSELTDEQKDYYIFIAAIVMSAEDFYENTKVELESSLLDSLATFPIKNMIQ